VANFVSQAIRRIRRDGKAVIPYTLGRFHSVRKLYSLQARMRYGRKRDDLSRSMFPSISVDEAVRSIRENSVFLPVNLPQDVVADLVALAKSGPLRAFHLEGREFFYSDVKDARLADGTAISWAHIKHIQQHPLAIRIARDPKVMEVVSRYLGYTPRVAEIWMFWSFAGSLKDDERRAVGQTIDYHFDVHSLSFAYAAYYLLDTNRENGAHVMVSGSHRDKPVSWLFGSANRGDQSVVEQYGADRVLTIEGPAGTGFWQDSSCYHKALPPAKGDRLLFQVRYH
jgi:hypothetical protein